jgi:hypothetical protein
VQAIGGVNYKIEGFFDICSQRGLSGSQGVLIPAANVKHLMLRPRVVEAVAAGRFHPTPSALALPEADQPRSAWIRMQSLELEFAGKPRKENVTV